MSTDLRTAPPAPAVAAAAAGAAPGAGIDPLRWLRAFVRTPYFAIWPATALLFAVSPLLASGSLDSSALLGMLPFAAILALAAAGQTLVVQQGGLDLSVPGMISLAAVIVSKYPQGSDGRLVAAILIALGACALAALISGVAITRFGITPLIATLGVNALLTGAVLQYTSGSASDPAPPALVDLASGKVAGIPNTVVIAAVLIALATFVVRRTILGRRFVAAGASPRAAFAAGIRVREQQLGTYVVAGLLYAIAGILLAGFLETPGLQPGQQYLLPSIAAVVLGGTALTGGTGSVAASAVGALFLTQLNQVVLGMGAASSVQLLIQGLIIALGMGLRNVPWSTVRRALTSGRAPASQRSD